MPAIHLGCIPGLRRAPLGLLVRLGIMAGERVTARKRKAGGKVVIKKRTKKFRDPHRIGRVCPGIQQRRAPVTAANGLGKTERRKWKRH